MRRALPAALLAPLLFPASALDASGPDLRIVSAPAVSLREAPGTTGERVARLSGRTVILLDASELLG